MTPETEKFIDVMLGEYCDSLVTAHAHDYWRWDVSYNGIQVVIAIQPGTPNHLNCDVTSSHSQKYVAQNLSEPDLLTFIAVRLINCFNPEF